MSVHDPRSARHRRVFELLRQTDSAVAATGACDACETATQPLVGFERIKANALHSFDRKGSVGRSSKSGRHDELF